MKTTLTRQDIKNLGFEIGARREFLAFNENNEVVTIYTYSVKSKKGNYLKPKIVKSGNGRRKQYIGYSIGKNTVSAARLFWAWFNGCVEAEMDIDHIDNNPFNNDLSNLQKLSHRENCIKRFIDDPENLVIAANSCKWARFCKYCKSLEMPKEIL